MKIAFDMKRLFSPGIMDIRLAIVFTLGLAYTASALHSK